MNNEEKILDMLKTMNSRFDNIDQRFDLTEERLDFIAGSVVRIENEHGRQLGLLADGHVQLNEKIDRIEAHVSVQDEEILKRVFPIAMDK